MLRYRWLRLLLVLATLGVGSLQEAATRETRISPNEVTVSNVEAFKEQMRRDLPLGTEKADVEAYLTRWNIDHLFASPDHFYVPIRNAFQARMNIGGSLPFRASLVIRIHLDTSDKVRAIVFREEALAP